MGLADDGGLLVPESVPDLSGEMAAWRDLDFVSLAKALLAYFAALGAHSMGLAKGRELPSRHTALDLVAMALVSFALGELGDGLNIVDASHPNSLVEVGYYDTNPTSGGGFAGAWRPPPARQRWDMPLALRARIVVWMSTRWHFARDV